jgi:2-amino-4-hydroxy-6-hydroxymethyldihydropteridine diphosphokinase
MILFIERIQLRNRALIGIGSNTGDREYYILNSLQRIEKIQDTNITRYSRVYQTEPVGLRDQPDFLNMVIAVATSLSPVDLLCHLQEIEIKLDRIRDVKWGPRTIDLDILLFNKVTMKSDRLTLPHPGMDERNFVMVPLLDICSSKRLKDAFNKSTDSSGINPWQCRNRDLDHRIENPLPGS